MSDAAPVGFSSSHAMHINASKIPAAARKKRSLKCKICPSIGLPDPKVTNRSLLFNKDTFRAGSLLAVYLMLILLSLSCVGGGSETTTMPWETQSMTEVGLPYFQLQTLTRSGKQNGVEISIGISPESVIFVRNGDLYEAVSEIVCRVIDEETEGVTDEIAWFDTLRTSEYRKTQSREIRYMHRVLPLAPGRYGIEVTLTDRNSDKSLTRVRRTRIAEGPGESPVAAGIQVSFRNHQGYQVPLLSPYADRTAGVLECSAELNNLLAGDSVVAIVEVLQVERDSALPRAPYSFSPIQGSIEHSGLTFDTPTAVLLDTMTLVYTEQSLIQWQFKPDQEGTYLLRAGGTVYRKTGTEMLAASTRPLVVVPRGFPRPTELDQLLGPLEYILLEHELDSLQRAVTEDSRRDFLENFWRSIARNEHAGSQLIDQYYARVEEANEYFSSFTEGWKTDRGMIYIVLGPPVSVQTGLQGEVWNYSYVDGDRLNSYFFRSVAMPEEFESLEHFLLERQPYYDRPWFAAVDRLRSGSTY